MRFLPPHTTAVQTNGLLMYTGTALPNPAAVRVERCFLSHFLKDLLSLQLCCRQVLLLLRFLLWLTRVPGPLWILALCTCADNTGKHQLDIKAQKSSCQHYNSRSYCPSLLSQFILVPFYSWLKLVNTTLLIFFVCISINVALCIMLNLNAFSFTS